MFRDNRAFWRAAHSLTHPLTVLAVIYLLVNDHWLRYVSPSWWTGKLGDAVWLIFAPFIVALIMALVIPRKYPQQENIVAAISFGFMGVWFATAKTIPAIHARTLQALEAVVGWRGSLRLDPTDLIALGVLPVGWLIWRHARTSATAKPFALPLTTLALLGTLATSPPPLDYGIVRLCWRSGTVFAAQGTGVSEAIYSSQDGGQTWRHSLKNAIPPRCSREPYSAWDLYSIDPMPKQITNGSLTVRFVPNDAIYVTEKGASEIKEYDLRPLRSESIKLYFTESLLGFGAVYNPNPRDILIDPVTGNVIFAMGIQGVLTRLPDASWHWYAVDQYVPFDHIDPLDRIFDILQQEFLVAVGLLLLLPSILWKSKTGAMQGIFEVLGWLMWLLLWSNLHSLTVLAMSVLGYFPLAWWTIVFVLSCLQKRDWGKTILPTFVIEFVVAASFLLPYVLWMNNSIPNHTTASWFSLILTISGIIAGRLCLNRRGMGYSGRRIEKVLP